MASPNSAPALAGAQLPTLLLADCEDAPPPPQGSYRAHHLAEGVAVAPTRSNDLAPFVVCADTRVYHLAATDSDGFNERLSLCGQVAQHPGGGRYRSGRAKPVGAWSTPRYYRCCTVCAATAQAQDEEELSHQAKVMTRLLKMARQLTDDYLWSAVHYSGPDWRLKAGREAAKLELDRRLREMVGRKAVAA